MGESVRSKVGQWCMKEKEFGSGFISILTQGCELLEFFFFLTRRLSAKIIHKILPLWPQQRNTKTQSDLHTLEEIRLLCPVRCNSIHITKPFFPICYQQKDYLQFKSLIFNLSTTISFLCSIEVRIEDILGTGNCDEKPPEWVLPYWMLPSGLVSGKL